MAIGVLVLAHVCMYVCMYVCKHVFIYYRLRCELVRIHTQLCLSITATELTFLIGGILQRTESKVKQVSHIA